MMFLAFERLDAGIRLHFHLAVALERGIAGDALDFGALEQHGDAVRVLGDDAVLALLHLGVVEARVFAADAFLIRVDEALPDIGGVEQGLGGDAPHQEAGAAEPGLFFDERRLETVLAGANGRGVAAGAAPDNNEIVGHFFHSTYVTSTEAGASTMEEMQKLLILLMLVAGCGFAQSRPRGQEEAAPRPPSGPSRAWRWKALITSRGSRCWR